MSIENNSRRTTALQVAIAALVGLSAGSYYHYSKRGTPEIEPPHFEENQLEPEFAETMPRPEAVERTGTKSAVAGEILHPPGDITTDDDGQTVIYAGPGYSLTPERDRSGFLGYRVVGDVSDERFDSGDIIVAIGGLPVEDSAAGGELLIAALQDTSVRLEVRSSEDE